MNIDELNRWIGRSETSKDTAVVTSLNAQDSLPAPLDHEVIVHEHNDQAPPLWRRACFVPPIPLRRGMWAGSQIECRRPKRVGSALSRTSRPSDVLFKEGRTEIRLSPQDATGHLATTATDRVV